MLSAHFSKWRLEYLRRTLYFQLEPNLSKKNYLRNTVLTSMSRKCQGICWPISAEMISSGIMFTTGVTWMLACDIKCPKICVIERHWKYEGSGNRTHHMHRFCSCSFYTRLFYFVIFKPFRMQNVRKGLFPCCQGNRFDWFYASKIPVPIHFWQNLCPIIVHNKTKIVYPWFNGVSIWWTLQWGTWFTIDGAASGVTKRRHRGKDVHISTGFTQKKTLSILVSCWLKKPMSYRKLCVWCMMVHVSVW
jgi:hypothetical protein